MARKATCWHCAGTNLCDCMFCLIAVPTGFAPGPCGFCKGRKEQDAIRPALVRLGVDPRDPRHWERRGNHRDQSAPKPVFLPLDAFRKRKENP